MSLNPRDYDLDELRRMAREGGHENGQEELEGEMDLGTVGPGEGLAAGASFRAGLYRELLPLEAGSDETAKPYLRTLPDQYAGEQLVFEWLEFLVLHAGYQGASDALSYYESIDWITADVESVLGDYLLGIDDAPTTEPAELEVDDHMLSLVYVAKLSAM